MAGKKYSDGSITDGVTANGTDRWPVLRSGGNVWISPAYLKTYINPMTTQDDIIIGGASGVLTRLAKGTDGQVLTVDPSTHHLVWATPSGGGGGYTEGAQILISSPQSISDATATFVTFGTTTYDTDTMIDLGTYPTRITIVTTGKYQVSFSCAFASNSTGYRYATVYEGGAALEFVDSKPAVNGTITGFAPSHTLSLSAGNYLEAKVYQNSGGSLNLTSAAFTVQRIG